MIWAVAGEGNPTDDQLARLHWATHRHRVVCLRVPASGLLAAGVWDGMRLYPFKPDPQHPAERGCSLERWGPDVMAAVRGEVMRGVTVDANVGSSSRGLAQVLVYWPGVGMDVLAAAREAGTRIIKISQLKAKGEE